MSDVRMLCTFQYVWHPRGSGPTILIDQFTSVPRTNIIQVSWCLLWMADPIIRAFWLAIWHGYGGCDISS